MSYEFNINDHPSGSNATKAKKTIKNPFNMDFDDNFSGGNDNSLSFSNTGSNNPGSVQNRSVSNPFASGDGDELSGNFQLSGKPKVTPATNINPNAFFNQRPTQPTQPTSTFTPSSSAHQNYDLDEFGDPPLLIDLGIDLQNIKQKTLSILTFKKVDETFLEQADMAGPMLFALAFGAFLLLNGKIHFGYIYGFFVVGCLMIYTIMNFLSQHKNLELYDTVSILGYGLLPIVILSALAVVLSMKSPVGFVLSLGSVLWASVTASRMMEGSLRLSEQKWLIAYPIFLFYLVFVILAVF